MIDAIYNSRLGTIKTYHFSDEWEKKAIPFEESLTEEQTIIFHQLCDLQSETAADEQYYTIGALLPVTILSFVWSGDFLQPKPHF